ncbi:MAG: hypothetical protein DRN15_01215 [Thermoprotei archaeon]|nr:MAG: hypothetical protein DRN15_01215 [Thermoprotei archaeon]RLF25806.1 MAG: hypothetical protein DRM97_00600 [Thermoprotei archaeon]
MPVRFTKKQIELILAISIALGLLFAIIPFAIGYHTKVKTVTIAPGISFIVDVVFYDFFVVGLIVALIPSSMAEYINYKWRKSIEKRLPHLFRDLAEASHSGMTIFQAIEEISRRGSDPLTEELRRVSIQLSLGASLEEALDSMARRVNTPMVRRCVQMITQTSKGGGKVTEVLDTIAEFTSALVSFEDERATLMRPYVWIIYTALIILLAISAMMTKLLIGTLSAMITALGAPEGLTIYLDPDFFKTVFFHAAVIESIIGGLMVGKISTGTAYGGFKHVLIMLIMTLITFNFLV